VGVLRVLPEFDCWAADESDPRSTRTGDDPAECLPVSVHDRCPLNLAEPFVRALRAEDAAAVLAPLRHRRAGDLRGLSAWEPVAPYLI
jgi:hypothetical protein